MTDVNAVLVAKLSKVDGKVVIEENPRNDKITINHFYLNINSKYLRNFDIRSCNRKNILIDFKLFFKSNYC